jgi:hypothetical protein
MGDVATGGGGVTPDRRRSIVVFIAGPYRAKTTWQRQGNIRRAREASLGVWCLGFTALCPHAETADFDGELPDQDWLDGALVLLERCNAVLAIRGWADSAGTFAEVMTAKARGIPVFYELADLLGHFQET